MKTVITTKKELPNITMGTVGHKGGSLPGINTVCFPNNKILDSAGSEYTMKEIEAAPDFFDIKTVYEPEDVKEGTYWEDGGSICRIMSDKKILWIKTNYSDVEWLGNIYDADAFCKHWHVISTPEIESALIKEAKRRGYKDGMIIINYLGRRIALHESAPNHYNPINDVLMYKGAWVYCEGVWAEITKEESPIEAAIKMLNELQGCVDKNMRYNKDTASKIGKIRNHLQTLKEK